MLQDTVTLELHNTAAPFTIVESQKAVLNNSGKGTFYFSNAVNGTSYYLVVKHRNGVETWSSNPVSLISYVLSYDFTTASSQAFGSNLVKIGTKWCIYNGDVNQDGLIDLSDLIAVDNDNANYVTGFAVTDVNGDGLVDLSDLILVDNNNMNYVSKVVPTGAPAIKNNRNSMRKLNNN
jgi:hypothetical protein